MGREEQRISLIQRAFAMKGQLSARDRKTVGMLGENSMLAGAAGVVE